MATQTLFSGALDGLGCIVTITRRKPRIKPPRNRRWRRRMAFYMRKLRAMTEAQLREGIRWRRNGFSFRRRCELELKRREHVASSWHRRRVEAE